VAIWHSGSLYILQVTVTIWYSGPLYILQATVHIWHSGSLYILQGTVAIRYSEQLKLLQFTVLQFFKAGRFMYRQPPILQLGIAHRFIFCWLQWQFGMADRFI
jgi:hemin uptake protein HemP